MKERIGATTIKGKPFTLLGQEIRVGEPIPDIEVYDNNFMPVKLSTYHGKVCIISSVYSLDTPVCDQQTHRFNESASKLGADVVVLTISMDLPPAQKRWCGNAKLSQAFTLSDYKEASFAKGFGLLIKELRMLGRAVFVIDQQGIVRYAQYVKELTEHPNYDEVLAEAKKLVK